MLNKKQTKVLVESWRAYLKEADETEAPAEGEGEKKTINIYDFDGVLGTFSSAMKQEFFDSGKATGTEIQIKNTLALGAALLAEPESVADHYDMLRKPEEPYYIVSKFANPVYIKPPDASGKGGLAYYKELVSFLSSKGLDMRANPNSMASKKRTVINKFVKNNGFGKPLGVMVVGNEEGNSKKDSGRDIANAHKGEKVKYQIFYKPSSGDAKRDDGLKEATMIKHGLVEANVGVSEKDVALVPVD